MDGLFLVNLAQTHAPQWCFGVCSRIGRGVGLICHYLKVPSQVPKYVFAFNQIPEQGLEPVLAILAQAIYPLQSTNLNEGWGVLAKRDFVRDEGRSHPILKSRGFNIDTLCVGTMCLSTQLFFLLHGWNRGATFQERSFFPESSLGFKPIQGAWVFFFPLTPRSSPLFGEKLLSASWDCLCCLAQPTLHLCWVNNW